MNNARREAIAKAIAALQEISRTLDALGQEEREYFENMPESFQQGEKGERADAAASALETATGSVDEAIGELEGIE